MCVIQHRVPIYTQGWPQPYIYGVYTVFWQGNHEIYGHILLELQHEAERTWCDGLVQTQH
jgi:hypothetical protein